MYMPTEPLEYKHVTRPSANTWCFGKMPTTETWGCDVMHCYETLCSITIHGYCPPLPTQQPELWQHNWIYHFSSWDHSFLGTAGFLGKNMQLLQCINPYRSTWAYWSPGLHHFIHLGVGTCHVLMGIYGWLSLVMGYWSVPTVTWQWNVNKGVDYPWEITIVNTLNNSEGKEQILRKKFDIMWGAHVAAHCFMANRRISFCTVFIYCCM